MIICSYANYMQRVVFSERVCCIIFQLHGGTRVCRILHACYLATRVLSLLCACHTRDAHVWTWCHSRGPFKLWVICTVYFTAGVVDNSS